MIQESSWMSFSGSVKRHHNIIKIKPSKVLSKEDIVTPLPSLNESLDQSL